MSAGKTVVILGGGVGGIAVAKRLRQLLDPRHRIVVGERHAQHVFAPSPLWLMTGQRRTYDITRPLQDLLDPGADLVHGEVVAIAPDRSICREPVSRSRPDPSGSASQQQGHFGLDRLPPCIMAPIPAGRMPIPSYSHRHRRGQPQGAVGLSPRRLEDASLVSSGAGVEHREAECAEGPLR